MTPTQSRRLHYLPGKITMTRQRRGIVKVLRKRTSECVLTPPIALLALLSSHFQVKPTHSLHTTIMMGRRRVRFAAAATGTGSAVLGCAPGY
jgi:hypothetical protein